MSILIKGMEMPKNGYIDIRLFSDGTATTQTGQNPFYKEFQVVEVPPHGRLIDADALIRELTLDDEDDNNGASLLMAIFLEVLKAAPTILEAEEGE